MPFRLDPEDPRCVQKQNGDGSWERVEGGCQESREEAEAQLAALRINVNDAEESVSDSQTKKFLESAEGGEPFAEAHVDRDTRTIRNVRLLGKQSKNGPNGRRYTESAINDAVGLYEGAQVYLDHPTRSEMRERDGVRSVRDLAGRITQPRKSHDGVRGDIQVLDLGEGSANNPADFFFSVAEQMPEAAGMSHRARGQMTVDDEGVEVIESLDDVAAVEVVTDPATTNGLFESIAQESEENTMAVESWDELTESELREHRPDLVEALTEEAEQASEADKLREENDRLKAEIAEREHRQMVSDKLAEADLPDRLVTDTFREQLQRADDEEAVEALIEDRAEIARSVSESGPRSTERNPDDLLESEQFDPVNDETVAEAADLLFA